MKGSHDQAQDALSKAMLLAREKLPVHFANIQNINGWLTRLTSNICIDMLRKQKKEILSCNLPDSFDYNNSISWSEFSGSPENKFLVEQKMEIVYQAINRLPSRLKEPMMLHLFMQIPYKEIAFEFNITCQNVRKRIQQARDMLQEILGQYDFDFSSYCSTLISMSRDSQVWFKAFRQARQILERNVREIQSDFKATSLFRVSMICGCKRSVMIYLEDKPSRLKIKINTLQQYVKRYPTGWKKQMELAHLLYSDGQWELSIHHYRGALSKHPLNLHGWLTLGEMLLKIGHNKAAEDVHLRALACTRKKAAKHHVMGLLKICRGQWNNAIQEFKNAASHEPGNPAHQFKTGYCYLYLGQIEEALESFNTVLEINPNHLPALTYSYEILMCLKQLEEAHKRIKHVLEIYPKDVLALKRMKDCSYQLELLKNEVSGESDRMDHRQTKCVPTESESGSWLYWHGFPSDAVEAVFKNTVQYNRAPCVKTNCIKIEVAELE